ncbi:hypothetical protein ACFL6B_02120 [Thermodesulfobacteriota bacterium]
MSGEVTDRKRTGERVCWICQNTPDIRQRSVANPSMARRPWAAWNFIVIVLLLSLTGCGWFEDEEFPTELLGRWVTNNPNYKECYMIIKTDTIVFHATDNNLYVSTIEKIESATEFGRKVYHITYSDKENIEYLLSVIVLTGSKKGRLQFYNQRYIEWNKMGLSKEEL